jgi:Bacteriophage related domain of unknown function
MTATVENEILTALNTHLNTMPNAWPRSFANVNFTPPVDGKYIRVSFQPNDTETYGLNGGPYRYVGLYQVSAIIKSGVGETLAIDQASLIARRFDYLSEITTPSGTVRVTQRPSVRAGVQGLNNYEIPVTIRYELTT